MTPLPAPLLLALCTVAAAATREPTDAHLPKPDPDAANALAAADAAAKAARWQQALRGYRRLLTADPDAACAAGADGVVGARHVGRLRLLGLPAEAREACRQMLDPMARPLLDELRGRREPSALAAFARLYGPSSQGPTAWGLVGDLAWERGQPARALVAYRRALAWEGRGKGRARVLAKTAVCLARLGRAVEAERALAEAREQGAALASVGGAALDAAWLRRTAEAQAAPSAERPGRCIWRHRAGRGAAAPSAPGSSSPWGAVLPTVGRGMVFLHGAGSVTALDEFSGETVWRYEPPAERRAHVARVLGTGSGGPLSATVGERHVYAAFLRSTGRAAPLHTRRRVHALDAATGRLVYVLGQQPYQDPLLERLSFAGMPVEREGVLYATGHAHGGVSDCYVLALEAATGRLLWQCYVCTGDAPRGAVAGPGHSAPLTVADGAVVLASNSGAVACVDAWDGSLRWVRRYARTGGYWRTSGGKSVTPWPGWRNAPAVVGGVVVAMPSDGESILGLDAATGEERWRRPRGRHAFVHGAARGIAVLGGRELEGVDAATGRSVWRRAAVDAVEARGLGVVGEGVAVCPTRRGLLTLDLATGRELACDGGAAGHYVPGRSIALVAAPHDVAAHCRPDAAIAGERRRVEAEPGAVEPRYRLAMALRVAERDAEAAAHLRVALERCLARDDAVAARVRAAAWRLFCALGERAEAAGTHDEAMRHYREAAAAATDPTRRVRALLGEARCLRAGDDAAGLVALYQQLVEHRPDVLYPFSPRVWTAASLFGERQLARLLAERGRDLYAPFEQAAARLAPLQPESAARLYPNSLAARRTRAAMADAARQRGDHAEAARHYAALLRRLEPGSREGIDAGLALARCYEQTGDFAAARAALEATATPAAAARLASPLYAKRAREPRGPSPSRVGFPLVHAWTATPAGLSPLALVGPRAPELEGMVLARDATTLHCLDAGTGEGRWRLELGEADRSETSWLARLHGGLVLLHGGRHLYAVEAETGAGRWMYDLGTGSAHVVRSPSWWGRLDQRRVSLPSMAFAAGRIFAATLDGRVVCLDAATGERRWAARLPGRPVSELRRLGDRLAVAIGPGCCAAFLDAGTGRVLEVVRLREDAPPYVPIWVGELIVLTEGGRATAYDARSGERRWSVAAARSGRTAIERFGSRLVLLSTAGSLAEIDGASGRVTAERTVGTIYAYLRTGGELFLLCRRAVGRQAQMSVEAYRGRGLTHLWFAAVGSSRSYYATATEQCVLVIAHSAAVRDVVVLDRHSGARLGTLDLEAFRPYSLGSFSSWPRHLLSTVHSKADDVEARRLVALSGGEGPVGVTAGSDRLLDALREGRITIDGVVALVRRHAERGAFEEAADLLDRAASGPKLSDTDYLRLGDAAAILRRKTLDAARPQRSITPLDWELPRPVALGRFRQLDLGPRHDAAEVERWRGQDDLSAQVYLAYTRDVLCVYAVVRDDVHAPGREGRGDRLEVLLARWEPERRQWGDGARGLAVALRGRAVLRWWLGQAGENTRRAVRCAATRDDERGRTTYWVLIPWRVLGEFTARRGAMVELAVAVQDADGHGPKGALRWAMPEPGLTGRLLLR